MSRILTLADVDPGLHVYVVEVVAGPGLKARLLQMGFTPGTEVEVLDNRGGTVLVRVRGATIALSRGIARKIVVEIKS